ncbi:hypothetical protein pdam_00014870, partial [Pocillopora damicornis]
MEEKQKELETELQLLALNRSKTAAIVDKGNLDKILRHKEILKKIVNAIEDLKVDIEKAKLEAGEIVENVQKWSATIEQRTDEADLEISDLTRSLEEAATRAEDYKREKEKTLLDRQREEELEFEKLKLEQKAKIQQTEQAAAKPASKSNVKMPKLIITKYDGTYEKWLSFWNKFEAEIDSSDLPAVTKFAHLKELPERNVCESIDGLPFTSEGYQRAKNILTSNYGKISEIVRAYIDNLNALPVITGSQPSKIHKFCQTLNYNVQSLETLGKLSSCFSMVRGVLDKLPGIKAELVSGKVGWQDWGFTELIRALEEWKAIHPLELAEKASGKPQAQPPPRPPRHRSFYAQEREPARARHACVYCDCVTHRSWECDKITSPAERRQILQNKRLCFNCTGPKHSANNCSSRASCVHCKQKHHSSICDRQVRASQPKNNAGVALTATQDGEKVCHPIVLVKVNGVTCRALLDTGATVSYASGYLLDRLKLRPTRTHTRRIQTIVGVVTKRSEIFNVQASDTDEKYAIPLGVTRIDPLSSEDEFSVLMEQHSLLKALRVCAWVSRFLTYSRNPKPRRVKGPLTTDEMKYQETWWTRRAQEEGRSSKNFEADKLQLNLQPDNNGILECRGRIVGAYPINLPYGNAFTHKLVQRAHLATLHGGVTLTMTKVRETHWIPRQRKLTKK